jgi:ribosomal protein S18 acetylase RimI-like enzyme
MSGTSSNASDAALPNAAAAAQNRGVATFPGLALTNIERSASLPVRQAGLGDLEVVAALLDGYRQFQGQASDLAASRDFLRARLERSESTVFLASVCRQPAGIAQLYPSFSTVALARVFILNDLYVAPAFRRAGVARALMQAVQAHGRSLGAVRVTLNVARSNAQAQALYRAQGWQQDQAFFMFHWHAD